MGAQFICGFEDRRLQLQQVGVTLNGIDFIEVLDQDAFAGTPRQQTLLVRLFRTPPASFDGSRVRIAGGVRIVPVRVLWAQPATAVTATGVSAAEAAWYAALPQAARTLVVRTDSSGDFSDYRLVITPGSPTDFDPILSSVEFSFKAECPTSLDCGEQATCPPELAVAPPIDYLAKDFSSFRRIMIDRLSAQVPDWRERSVADVGVMLVELLAYRADHLSYYQDAVGTEAYLGTARKRISIRRHARLVGYEMHEGVNARAWVHLAATADDVVIRRADGTRFVTRCDASPVITPTAYATVLERDKPEVFEPLHDVTLYTSHNRIDFYTWGQRECCLPAGATRATLRDPEDRLRLRAGDVLVFEAIKGASSGLDVDADPARRHAVRLTRVIPEASLAGDGTTRVAPALQLDALTGIGYVEVEWHAEDALPAPLCISSTDRRGVPIEAVSVARGNVVLVDHGRTTAARDLPTPGDNARTFRPVLRESDIAHVAPFDPAAPASRSLACDPHASTAAVIVSDDAGSWRVRRSLLDSDRFDRDLVVEIDDQRRAHLRFGDGTFGRQPAAGTALAAACRIGAPLAGNVGAETITHIVTGSTAIAGVRNPLPAEGGTAPETTDETRIAAPQAFRVQQRAVTEADYAAIAERHPQVQKAVATRRWTGSWHTMYVAIDRKGGEPVDRAFADELRDFLEWFRLSGHDIEIESPRFVPLDIVLPVCVTPGYRSAHVLRALLDRFSARRLANGETGYFHPDRWTFARPVYLSSIIEAAMSVPGVEWIDMSQPTARFQRWGEPTNDELASGVIEMARLEIVRLDNSPSFVENGRFSVSFIGGHS